MMERSSSLLSLSSRSSSRSSNGRNNDPLLPYSSGTTEKPRFKYSNSASHSLYRRVVIWTILSLLTVALVLFNAQQDLSLKTVAIGHPKSQDETSPPVVSTKVDSPQTDEDNQEVSEEVFVAIDDVQPSVTSETDKNTETEDEEANDESEYETKNGLFEEGYVEDAEGDEDVQESVGDEEFEVKDEDDPDKINSALENIQKMPWLKFPHLNGYFFGLKTLVNKSDHVAEYPNPSFKAPSQGKPEIREIPQPLPYNPYKSSDKGMISCYLDKENKVPAPSIYAYQGVPQHMPDPAIGSYDVLGIRNDVCFDRFGRYGPYGLGYRLVNGGTSVGMNTESSDSEEVWKESGQINYSRVNWGDAQERCQNANWDRFRQVDPETEKLEPPSKQKKSRTAVVVRLYTGFKWTYLAVLNFRALITELALKSGGEYTVHFLMHVRDDSTPIWSDEVTVQRVLEANVPPEFHSMVTLWSESQMRLFYPGGFGESLQNPSGQDIHGVYRSAHLPLQVFAMQHPEYDHIWNWEMDMRYLGNYYELLDRIGKWTTEQARPLIWERSSRYYIPSYHGTWENFTRSVEQNVIDSQRQPVFGPLNFAGKHPLRQEQRGHSVLPSSCTEDKDGQSQCGVGEEADLITLNPIFDIEDSGWVFMYDTTGYSEPPPRRCAIVTASRLSRRLLMAMHEEVWRHHHTMFSERFPPSVALHHGFKAVYAPHPIHLDRAWSPLGSPIDAAFNGGRDRSTSGKGSPFDLFNEHNHKGTTWYYNSEFAGLLWRRWLGYPQPDGRGRFSGQLGEGTMQGGLEEEEGEHSTGRMCLRSMLLHPIKREDPSE